MSPGCGELTGRCWALVQEARAALRRVEAERSALEECLAVTSVSTSAALPAVSMSLQPAPLTPQPHRNANPTSNMSDGEATASLCHSHFSPFNAPKLQFSHEEMLGSNSASR